MYIESVECPTVEFSGRRFLVQSDETLRAILATSASHALVNRQKSLIDVDGLLGLDETRVDPACEEQRETKRAIEVVARATVALRDSFDAMRDGNLQLGKLGSVADDLSDRIDASPDIFLKVTRLKTKDEGTYVHSLAVSALMMRLARALDYEESAVHELGVAGLLHDVGKLGIPNEILNKTGVLDLEEKRLIRSHPDVGHRLLRELGNVSELTLDICLYHHETLDGSGYPAGLKAARLTPEIRLATVCDVFEALTSARAYKMPWEARDALKWMFDRGHLFDKKLVLRLASVFS
jgi:putative nucleotidyltransferase with HDIG domain